VGLEGDHDDGALEAALVGLHHACGKRATHVV
jgi:hypothetical protein